MKSIKLPKLVREFLAETLGTFILVLFGDAAIAQVVGGSVIKPGFFGGFQSIAFGYGFALIMGILVSGGISGGHLNPAVTLTMAVLKKCKWIQVPVYMAGQYIGAFLASAVVYGNYADAINMVEGGSNRTGSTQGIFASYPFTNQTSGLTLAFDQILGTALLLIIILAVTDEKNMKVISGLVPLLIGLGLTAIHISFGLNAGCAINPARDFAPRLFTLMAGWGSGPFTDASSFFWIPWILPHVGGIIGGCLYQLMIGLHHPEDDF